MKNKKILVNTLIFVLLFVCVLSLFLTVALVLVRNSKAGYAITEYNENEVDEYVAGNIYYEGDVVKFPSVIKVDGNDVSVTHAVTYPSGKASVLKVIELSEKGQYDLVYKNESNKVVYKTNIMVYEKLFSVNPEKSEVFLGKVREYTDYNSDITGAIVSLANGDKLTYNEIIDLNDNTKSDKLFSVKVLPEKGAEVGKIVFTLTDVYDSDNYLTFTITRSNPYPEYIMLTVNAPEQKPTGLELWYELEPWSYIYEGNFYRLHSGDGYGTYLFYSMDGQTDMPFNVSMNYAEKKVFFNGSFVVDLDDPTIFPTTWNGFKSGLCKLSIVGGSYSKNKFNFLLTDIDGRNKFDKNYVVDDVAPEITVDDKDVKDIYAMQGVKFKMPSATAFDQIDGVCTVSSEVYVNYGYSTQTSIYVSNGYFIPSTVKTHSIVYTAKDLSGNKAVKVVDVSVKDKNTPLISVTHTGNGATVAAQGEYVNVSDAIVVNSDGKYTLTITAENKYETLTIGSDMSFRPLYAGDYTIKYSASDYIATSESSYIVNVTSVGAKSIFDEDPVVPEYIILNAVYKTPVMYGYRFSDGKPLKVQAQTYINSVKSFNGATLLSGETFTCNESDKCFLGFKIDDAEKWFDISIVDVGYGSNAIRIYDYFVGDDTQITPDAKSSYTNYRLVGVNDTASVKFVNSLQIFDFAIEFVIPSDRAYDIITFEFNDIYSAKGDKVILYVQIQDNGGIKCYENPDNSCSIGGVVGNRLIVGYSDDESCFTFYCGNTVRLKTNGKLGGFTEKKANISIHFNSKNANITIYKVNNQPISSAKKDLAFSEYTNSKMYGRFEKGTTVKIAAFYCGDVLSPYCKVEMSAIKSSNGEYITALDGTVLDENADYSRDYFITLSDFCYYNIKYKISDGANLTTSSYAFFCMDMEGPSIEIGPHITEYKKGDTIVVGNYKAQDNESKNCNVYIVVIMPDNRAVVLSGNALKTSISGEYKVYYYAFDDAKNATVSKCYTITVKD